MPILKKVSNSNIPHRTKENDPIIKKVSRVSVVPNLAQNTNEDRNLFKTDKATKGYRKKYGDKGMEEKSSDYKARRNDGKEGVDFSGTDKYLWKEDEATKKGSIRDGLSKIS